MKEKYKILADNKKYKVCEDGKYMDIVGKFYKILNASFIVPEYANPMNATLDYKTDENRPYSSVVYFYGLDKQISNMSDWLRDGDQCYCRSCGYRWNNSTHASKYCPECGLVMRNYKEIKQGRLKANETN